MHVNVTSSSSTSAVIMIAVIASESMMVAIQLQLPQSLSKVFDDSQFVYNQTGTLQLFGSAAFTLDIPRPSSQSAPTDSYYYLRAQRCDAVSRHVAWFSVHQPYGRTENALDPQCVDQSSEIPLWNEWHNAGNNATIKMCPRVMFVTRPLWNRPTPMVSPSTPLSSSNDITDDNMHLRLMISFELGSRRPIPDASPSPMHYELSLVRTINNLPLQLPASSSVFTARLDSDLLLTHASIDVFSTPLAVAVAHESQLNMSLLNPSMLPFNLLHSTCFVTNHSSITMPTKWYRSISTSSYRGAIWLENFYLQPFTTPLKERVVSIMESFPNGWTYMHTSAYVPDGDASVLYVCDDPGIHWLWLGAAAAAGFGITLAIWMARWCCRRLSQLPDHMLPSARQPLNNSEYRRRMT
jgi:hypothetical protein